jgi:hypothetical protein
MLQLSTNEFEFEIDGKKYTLPQLNIDMFGTIAVLANIENKAEQMFAFRDAILNVASEEAGVEIRKLSISAMTSLFREWTGLGGGQVQPGESSNSPA